MNTLRFAIADPPYLGRAVRWYSDSGQGHSGGRGVADAHPDAAEWDSPERHRQLIDELDAAYDGWAVAMNPESLHTYLAFAAPPVRIATWVKGNAVPSGSRVRNQWEPVLFRIPDGREGYDGGVLTDDVLFAGVPRGGFAGRKPEAWTHWVLDMLGYRPGMDHVDDLFPGSGAVTAAIASYKPQTTDTRPIPRKQRERLATVRRSRRTTKAAVLAALAAGASVRKVAAAAGVAPSTVQRWKSSP